MRSKIIKLSLALSVVVFYTFSCDNSSETPLISKAEAIRFSSQILTLTQSKSIITDEVLPSNSQIGVFAWGHHKDAGAVNTSLRSDLTNNLHTKIAGSELLTASVDAHYPINPDTSLNFYAYYPYVVEATNAPQSIPFDLSKQNDIMWATPVLNRSKTTSDQNVNLAFNHVLSAITIKFKKADDIKEDMILESISLANYSPFVQLNVQDGKLAQTTSGNAFTIIDGQNTTITPQEQTIVTDYLLCPVVSPTFIVRLSNKDYAIKSNKAFEAGKKQTYEFTIQASDIHLSGSINPWVDGGSSNETVYF